MVINRRLHLMLNIIGTIYYIYIYKANNQFHLIRNDGGLSVTQSLKVRNNIEESNKHKLYLYYLGTKIFSLS